MALLFSAVTVTASNEEFEFTVGGIPREYDDLVGWTAFDDFIENVDAETEVNRGQRTRRSLFVRRRRNRDRHSRGGRISDDAHGTG